MFKSLPSIGLSKKVFDNHRLKNCISPTVKVVSTSVIARTPADGPVPHGAPYCGRKHVFNYDRKPFTAGHHLTKPTKTMVRFAHSDVKFPGYKDVRIDKDIKTGRSDHSYDNQKIYYGAAVLAGSSALVAVKAATRGYMDAMLPCAAEKLSNIVEFDLGLIPLGKFYVLKWGKRPLFISHRTDSEIEECRTVPMKDLKDPQTDEARTPVDPKWLIQLGICSHLGCVPHHGKGNFGGFYCPCHGSHYDKCGRIRAGPAPKNLTIPEYKIDNNMLYLS